MDSTQFQFLKTISYMESVSNERLQRYDLVWIIRTLTFSIISDVEEGPNPESLHLKDPVQVLIQMMKIFMLV